MAEIKYDNYEKISDDIMFIGYNTVMRMNVSLSYKNEYGERESFHKEYRYRSSKYINTNTGITIRRRFDYYISIENVRQSESGEKAYIRLGLKDIPYFRQSLHEATEWFLSPKYKDLFIIKNNQIKINRILKPLDVGTLPMDNFMKILPVAINDTELGKYRGPGARILLSSETNFVDLTPDMVIGLVEFFNTFNMFQSAQIMLTYIQRPAYGSNIYSFNGDEDNIEELDQRVNSKSKVINRQIPMNNQKPKSSFDDIDNL